MTERTYYDAAAEVRNHLKGLNAQGAEFYVSSTVSIRDENGAVVDTKTDLIAVSYDAADDLVERTAAGRDDAFVAYVVIEDYGSLLVQVGI